MQTEISRIWYSLLLDSPEICQNLQEVCQDQTEKLKYLAALNDNKTVEWGTECVFASLKYTTSYIRRKDQF